MKKKEEKIIPVINEEPKKEVIIVIEKQNKKSKLIDCVKFGVGFYIGFKLARTAKNGIIKAVNALK